MFDLVREVHVGLLALDVLLGLSALVATFAGGSRRTAWVLLVAAAAWLPLDNRLLEGPVLVSVGDRHGLTLSDLIGMGGVAVAALRLWTPRGDRWWPWAWRWGARVLVVIALGLVVAAGVTDSRVFEGEGRPQTHGHHQPQEAAFELRIT